jgi:hypothetical protein
VYYEFYLHLQLDCGFAKLADSMSQCCLFNLTQEVLSVAFNKFGLRIFRFSICTVSQLQYLLYLVVLLGCRTQKSSDSQILIVVKVQECTRAT